jgi:hypothetical protein
LDKGEKREVRESGAGDETTSENVGNGSLNPKTPPDHRGKDKPLILHALVTRPLKNFPIPGRAIFQHWGLRISLYQFHMAYAYVCDSDLKLALPPPGIEFCLSEFVCDLEIGEAKVIRPRVQCYHYDKWVSRCVIGIVKLRPSAVNNALATHTMNGTKYHAASNNCQHYITTFLESIDEKLAEDLPKQFSDTLLGQVSSGKFFRKKKLMVFTSADGRPNRSYKNPQSPHE